jgi:8-oxo-dGTP pyrophosphatase MutT (NUDIX family)
VPSRDELAALLASHEAADEEEAADLERMRRWACSLEQPCSRDQAGAHFTASAVVVDEAGRRTLLVHHRKSGSWFQPGGHIEPGDGSPAEAALREAGEETGLDVRLAAPCLLDVGLLDVGLLDVDVHWIPWDEHYHLDLRFLAVATGDLAPDAAEVHAAEWLTWDEAFARIEEPALRRALTKARASRPAGSSGRESG